MARIRKAAKELAWSKRVGLIIFLLTLVAIRAMLPVWLKDYVNETLDSLDGYHGHVEDVDLYLWRGAYGIDELQIEKTSGDVPVPFLDSPRIDLSLRWKALFDGALVGEAALEHPTIHLVMARAEDDEQTELGDDWRTKLEKLFPLRFDHVMVNDGEIHLQSFQTSPQFDLYLHQIDGVASNLTNSADLSESLWASVKARGLAMKDAPFELNADMDPLAEKTTFSVEVEVTEVELPELNDFLKAHAKADARSGRFSLYAEFATSEGRFEGYAKPFLEDAEILDWEQDSGDNPLRIAWEAVVEGVSELLENDENVATRIPYKGSLDEPDAGLLESIVGLLRNAFIDALGRGIEHSIEIEGKS